MASNTTNQNQKQRNNNGGTNSKKKFKNGDIRSFFPTSGPPQKKIKQSHTSTTKAATSNNDGDLGRRPQQNKSAPQPLPPLPPQDLNVPDNSFQQEEEDYDLPPLVPRNGGDIFREEEEDEDDLPPLVSRVSVAQPEVIVLLDSDSEEEQGQDDIVLPNDLPVKIPDDDDTLRSQCVPRYPRNFRDTATVPPAAQNHVLSKCKEAAESTVDRDIAVNIGSEWAKQCNFTTLQDFRLDVENDQVYAMKFPNREKPKIGSTGNSRTRLKHLDKRNKEFEYCYSILNLDALDGKDDAILKEVCKTTVAEPLTFSTDEEIPMTLEEHEKIENETGVNMILQHLFYWTTKTAEESPYLGGADQVWGFSKTLFSRVLESGFQELFAELLDEIASMHEFLDFDKDALKKSLERAYKFFRLMLGASLKYLMDILDLDLDAAKDKLVEIVKAFRHYMGNWAVGGLNQWTEATPLIVQFMMMIGSFATHNHHDKQEWFSNSFDKATTADGQRYNPSSFGTDDKIRSYEKILARILFGQKNPGVYVFDPNEITFEEEAIKEKKLRELFDNMKGCTLVAEFGDELLLYFYYDKETKNVSIFAIIRPLCFMINSDPKFPIEKFLEMMIDRAIFAEALRLLIAWCENGCKDVPQNKMFDGSIIIPHHGSQYFALGLNGSRKTAALVFKQLVTPLEFNMMLPQYNGMSKCDYSKALSKRARHIDSRASNQRTRTADAMACRKGLHIMLNPKWPDLNSAMGGVVTFLGNGVSTKTKHTRLAKFAKQYVKGELSVAFDKVKNALKANKGNCQPRKQRTTPVQVDVDKLDEKMKEIIAEVDSNGEKHFWVPGYKARFNIVGKQRAELVKGATVMWEGKEVEFNSLEGKMKVKFLERFECLEFGFNTLQERFKSQTEMEEEDNRMAGHHKSVKVCTDKYRLEKCHVGSGPFNADERRMGWVLMRVVLKEQQSKKKKGVGVAKKKKGNKNNIK